MNDHERYRNRLEALSGLKLNLDLERREEFTAANGWNLDQYEAELPPEAPGEPEAQGSFAEAQSLLREYKFPPPDLITGIFVPDVPLEERVMLLRARFLGFTFFFGVKISGVTDEVRVSKGLRERIWGYRYATLEGHFERGQIEFLIAKDLSGGAVRFRISAFSKTGVIKNPFYRLGFLLFGRRLQRRFARDSLRRVQQLVTAALHTNRPVGERPEVKPASADATAQQKLEELTKGETR